MSRQKQSDILHKLTANSIRFLSVDAIEKSNSGHPGMPMGMANVAAVLWSEYMSYYPGDPEWRDRDRFILSAGHGSMLLYSILHLAGFDISIDDIKNFRQWRSTTPGHPELGMTPGVETTTGPLGQGFANGVGMAVAAQWLSTKFKTSQWSPLNHYIYGIISDGDLMEGISHEAGALAGHLGLGRIIYFYDDNEITIEGRTNLAFTEDTEMRFKAYNWHTQIIDGHNPNEIRKALDAAQKESDKPSIIITKTHIGYGSPNKQDTAGCHGSPLGIDETLITKKNLGWPIEPPFFVPEEVYHTFEKIQIQMKSEYDNWKKNFQDWQTKQPEFAKLWTQHFSPKIPNDLCGKLLDAIPEKSAATRVMGGAALQKAAELFPGLIGGSADLSPSTKTTINNQTSIQKDSFTGRNIHFGIREHAMGAILNGMAVYGGIKPYGSTFFVFSDYMRPPIRLAALMKLPSIFIFTHDSVFVGEDGPTHQPVEHLAALRVIPNVTVFRPAERVETAAAWAHALLSKDSPTVLCLSRQNVENIVPTTKDMMKNIEKGGYILERAISADLIIIGSGSELSLAIEAAKKLRQKKYKIQVVSMPSQDLFLCQDDEYRRSVLPAGTPVVVIEAGVSQGWFGIVESPMTFIGIEHFGASAPASVLAEKFGLTVENVVNKALKLLS
ncbi:transketolase [bacterium]|nr:transketolase [bacterium]